MSTTETDSLTTSKRASAGKILVAGVVFGAAITGVVLAHDVGSSGNAVPVAQPSVRGVSDVDTVSGPGGEMLLDKHGDVLVYDDSKLNEAVISELTLTPVPEGSAQVLVIYEHLPELFAAGVVYPLRPGSSQLLDDCDQAVPPRACDLRDAAGLRRAEASGNARRVDPTSFRG